MLKTEIGANAENRATEYITKNGLVIVQQNFKALPYGEIDIIALDNDILVFVEVKFRKSKNFGTAESMVSISKQQKIINTAHVFLQQNESYANYECRFDVVAINNSELNWIKSAFFI